MPAWPPAFFGGGGQDDEESVQNVSAMTARLFHIRKYRDMIHAQVRSIQEKDNDTRDAATGRYLVSRMLLLEELEETIRQLEKLSS